MTQIGFFIDQTRCTGCHTCFVACKDWYDRPSGPYGFLRIKKLEEGSFPNLFLAYLPMACNHCENPPCAKVCPSNAILKREEDGIVLVNSDKCLGNVECDSKCLKVCPYDAPQFDPEKGSKMTKCNLCVDRLEENKLPICVEACPMYAIEVDDIEKLKQKYGNIREAEGFIFHENYNPSIIFKPKKSSLPKKD